MKKLLETDYSKISIHAPRTGSDFRPQPFLQGA